MITVPCGTVVKKVEREERYDEETESYEIVDYTTIVSDLDKPDSQLCLAKGGKPGLGSRILTGKTTKYGRLMKKMPEGKNEGVRGDTGHFEFELKTIADIGFVGYPNAGKSTLLSVISRAEPQIAAYPFTTLHPHIGMVEFPDAFRMSVADLPGLIDGAHRNVGLGHDFLRHIERTRILCYVLDTAGTEGRDPVEDFQHLQKELELYAQGITSRPSIIVANKMDQPDAANYLSNLRKQSDLAIIPISASHEVDIPIVVKTLRWMVENYGAK